MRWLDLLSSLRPENLAELKGALETDFGRPFNDAEVRDAARRLCMISDLMFFTDSQPEGERKGSEEVPA